MIETIKQKNLMDGHLNRNENLHCSDAKRAIQAINNIFFPVE